MEDASKAKASIAALNEFNLNGNRIKVEVSGSMSVKCSNVVLRMCVC